MIELVRGSGYDLAPLSGEDLQRELEEVIVAVAAGAMAREPVEAWLAPRIVRRA